MNFKKTVLYTGVTNSLKARIIEHYINRGEPNTFAGRYNAYWLVFYEYYDSIEDAIRREKQIKGWSKEKKLALIKKKNPELRFLNEELFKRWPPSEGQLDFCRNGKR